MSAPQYAFGEIKENMSRAYGRSLQISTKASIEIAAHLRGRKTAEAKRILGRVLQKKEAIPFKRFTDGVGHRKGAGIAAGRYPINACTEFLKLIKQAEANAAAKGLSEDLVIVHLAAHKASSQFHYGRQRRRKFKRTHVEIVVEEIEKKEKPAKKQAEKTPAKKQESTEPKQESQPDKDKPKDEADKQ